MGAPILQLGCTTQCPQGGTTNAVPAKARVKVGGNYALPVTDTYIVAGCPFILPGPKPSPCLTMQWQAEAQRVRVTGKPVLLQTGVGLRKSPEGLVRGTAIISGVQTQVTGA